MAWVQFGLLSDALKTSDGTTLVFEDRGEGSPVVLLHGLTATRRYVVMGSRYLERNGQRVISYDARGHGESDSATTPAAYEYSDLAGDLERALDNCEIERATLAGASMGAHTALHFVLSRPDRVAALVLITPAYDPDMGVADLTDWQRLADGLREGGVEGFMAAYDPPVVPSFRDAVLTATRQRMQRHLHLDAVADALEVVPASRPFESFDQLGAIACPVTVVGSLDAADPSHPLATAKRYADAMPGARLITESEGESPLAWQGAQLSKLIAQTIVHT